MGKQLFLSHAWVVDEEGRDTHARARLLAARLGRLGWTTWFDEVDMKGNVDAAMASGIDECESVIMLLTKAYGRKVNHAARKITSNDNCLKEFEYALFREKNVLPVIFESSMSNPHTWSPGVLPMRLAMTLYVDGTGAASQAAEKIHVALISQGLRPRNRVRLMMRQRSRSTPPMRTIGGDETGAFQAHVTPSVNASPQEAPARESQRVQTAIKRTPRGRSHSPPWPLNTRNTQNTVFQF